MPSILELFDDPKAVQKIQARLPYLFHLARQQASRGEREGMEAGTLREQILIAMLMHRFGKENIQIPDITDRDADVLVFGESVSIKTVTGKYPQIKLFWGSDRPSMVNFASSFEPKNHLLVVLINWGGNGPMAVIPLEAQREVFQELGTQGYLFVPKEGVNSRGVALSTAARRRLLAHPDTKRVDILWTVPAEKDEGPYKYWLNLWEWDQEVHLGL